MGVRPEVPEQFGDEVRGGPEEVVAVVSEQVRAEVAGRAVGAGRNGVGDGFGAGGGGGAAVWGGGC